MSRRSQQAPGARDPRRHTGTPFIGKANTTKSTIHAIGTSGSNNSTLVVICPVCNEPVKTRQRNTLVGLHRIGTRRNQSYPCAGDGMSTEGLEVVSE